MSWEALIDNAYAYAVNTPSDINEHIPLLYEIGSKCNHITEMGVRFGTSTRAFLKTDAVIRAYDLELNKRMIEIFGEAVKVGKDVEYIQGNVLKLEIEPTDFLFIDTWHSYGQLRQELKLHGNKASKYLGFHDTITFGLSNEAETEAEKQDPHRGLLPAIIEFVIENPHWKFKEFRTNNNGLTILERE